jgi:delta-aminolevulinic acid dehydratase/porphobilinogen synthase
MPIANNGCGSNGEECKKIEDLGIPAVILFGIPEIKDEVDRSVCETGVIPPPLNRLKKTANRWCDHRNLPLRIHQHAIAVS